MIFKTFNSDSDKFISKIGILGKSFEELGNSVRQRKLEINDLMASGLSEKEAKSQVGGISNFLFGEKSTNSKPKDLALFDNFDANSTLQALREIELQSANNKDAWQEYFSELDDGQKWQVEFVQNNNLSKVSLEQVEKAQQAARKAAIDHNNELKQMTLGAKASEMALNGLSMAGNMLLMWGVSEIISLAVKGIDNLMHASEKCKERVNSLMDSYNSAIDTANSNAKSVENIASRYEELSKGVNNLGENVSLTTKEYTEYHNICNQIADMFPTLISGYDSEGNAILALKGNVEGLRDAYKEAQQEAYRTLIVSGEDSDGNDIIDNFKNQVYGNESWISKTSSFIDGEAGAKDAIDVITRLTSASTPDEFRNTYDTLYKEYKNIWHSDKIQDALKSSGFKELAHEWSEITKEDLTKVKHSAQATIQTYQAEIDSALQNVKSLANAYLMTNEDYAKLDDESKNAASIIVNSIDENIANAFSNKQDVGTYVIGIVDTLKNNPEAQDALINLFKLDKEKLSPTEAKTEINGYIETLASILHEDESKLKIRLGFGDVDELAESYDNAVSSTKKKFEDKSGFDWDSWFKENSINTQEEIEQWLEIAEAADTAAEARVNYVKILEVDKTPTAFTDAAEANKDAIDQIQSSASTLQDAINKLVIGELDTSSVIDLLQQFPQLAYYVDLTDENFGNLEEGLKAVKADQLNYVITALKEIRPESEQDEQAINSLIESLEQMGGIQPNNFTDMNSNLESIISNVSSLTDAMKQLAEGTALSKSQLVDLAMEYPKLLEASDLFTDGSVEGQQNMLQAIIDMHEQQYDAVIDKKIAELEAENQAFQDQIDLQRQKNDFLLALEADCANGKIKTQDQLDEKMLEFQDIAGQNYVAFENGKLTATQEALTANLEVQNEHGEKSEPIWQSLQEMETTAVAGGVSNGISGLNSLAPSISAWISNVGKRFKSLANTISNALIGKDVFEEGDISTVSTSYTTGGNKATYKGSNNLTIVCK